MDLEQTPEFGVYDEEEDNVSRTTPKPTSWPWSKFTTEKNEEYAVGENDEWDDDTEALPYKVLEKRFVSSVAKTEIFRFFRKEFSKSRFQSRDCSQMKTLIILNSIGVCK